MLRYTYVYVASVIIIIIIIIQFWIDNVQTQQLKGQLQGELRNVKKIGEITNHKCNTCR
jgi:hypothetical protein